MMGSVPLRLAIPTACDIRVAAEDAKVGFTMAARGLCNESLSSYLLPRAIGSAAAKELVFTGRVRRSVFNQSSCCAQTRRGRHFEDTAFVC